MKTVLQILEYKVFKVTRFCNQSVQTWQESTPKIIKQQSLKGNEDKKEEWVSGY